MQSRRVARELALLSVSQLPATAAKLESKPIEDLVLAAIRSLEREVHDTLEKAADGANSSDRQLQDTESAVPLPLSPTDEPQSKREAAGYQPELARVRQAQQQLHRQMMALNTADATQTAATTLLSEIKGVTENAIAAVESAANYLEQLERRLQGAREEMHEAIATTQIAINQLGSAISLPEFVRHAEADEVRAYAIRVAAAVQTHKSEIDAQIEAALVNWKLSRLGRIERDILRVAVTELSILNSVPQRVAINEAVELAKKYADDEAASFLNGVLRRLITPTREQVAVEAQSPTAQV